MSTRAMARYYSNLSGGGGSSGGGMGSQYPWLSELLGKNKITGGDLVSTPEGTDTTPYKGSSGFFGLNSRMKADTLNRELQMAKLANILELERGKALESHRGSVDKDTHKSKAYTDLLKAVGREDSPETRAHFEALISKPRGESEASRAGAESELMATPEGTDAVKRQLMALMLAPEVANTKALTTHVGPNELVTTPGGPGFSPNRIDRQILGTTEEQNIVQTGGFTDPKTGQVFGGDTTVRKTTRPPVIKERLPSSILDAAGSVSESPEQELDVAPAENTRPFGNGQHYFPALDSGNQMFQSDPTGGESNINLLRWLLGQLGGQRK